MEPWAVEAVALTGRPAGRPAGLINGGRPAQQPNGPLVACRRRLGCRSAVHSRHLLAPARSATGERACRRRMHVAVGIISRSIVSRAGAAKCQPNHGATARDSCHRRRYDGVLAGWLRRIQVKKLLVNGSVHSEFQHVAYDVTCWSAISSKEELAMDPW